MHRYIINFASFILALAGVANPAYSQVPQAEGNARTLRSYMQPYAVTKLEWELLQTNLLWAGFRTTPSSYLTSYPLLFDHKTMRFRTFFSISERREYPDPEPWSQLPRLKRESILQGAVDDLRNFVSQSFPEVKSRPELLFVEFKYKQTGGAFVNGAKYENGTLSLAE